MTKKRSKRLLSKARSKEVQHHKQGLKGIASEKNNRYWLSPKAIREYLYYRDITNSQLKREGRTMGDSKGLVCGCGCGAVEMEGNPCTEWPRNPNG